MTIVSDNSSKPQNHVGSCLAVSIIYHQMLPNSHSLCKSLRLQGTTVWTAFLGSHVLGRFFGMTRTLWQESSKLQVDDDQSRKTEDVQLNANNHASCMNSFSYTPKDPGRGARGGGGQNRPWSALTGPSWALI